MLRIMGRAPATLLTAFGAIMLAAHCDLVSAAAPDAELVGARRVAVVYQGQTSEFYIAPSTWKVVTDEKWNSLPVFNPNANSWMKGAF